MRQRPALTPSRMIVAACGGGHRRLVAELPRALGARSSGCRHPTPARGPARGREARPRLRDLPPGPCASESVAEDLRVLKAITVPMWPGMTTEHLTCGAFTRRSMMQRLGEALHRELGRAVGGVREPGPERGPEAVDAAGVDDVALVRRDQHRQERARAVVDAAPADPEGALPLRATVDEELPPPPMPALLKSRWTWSVACSAATASRKRRTWDSSETSQRCVVTRVAGRAPSLSQRCGSRPWSSPRRRRSPRGSPRRRAGGPARAPCRCRRR